MSELRVTLFEFKSDSVKVSIEAYFEGEFLIIDGYDIGKTVEEFWHREDYEYKLTIPTETVQWMMAYFIVSSKAELLQTLARQFGVNNCYSAIRDMLDLNKQPYTSFTW